MRIRLSFSRLTQTWFYTLGGVVLSGCSVLKAPINLVRKSEPGITKEQVQAQLDMFSDNFSRTIQRAAEEIRRQTEDPEIRRKTVWWKIQLIPLCRNAVLFNDPPVALLDVWALCELLLEFLEEGSGMNSFGPVQPVAVEAIRQLEQDIEEIAALFLPEKKFSEAREGVHQFARDHAVREGFGQQILLPSQTESKGKAEYLSWVNSIPSFGSLTGLSDTAVAISEMSLAADRFTRVASHLPEETQWQAQLLLYDLEDRDTVRSVRDGLLEISRSATNLTETANRLPMDVEQILLNSLDQLDAKNEGIQSTLKVAQDTSAEFQGLLSSAEPLAGALERTSANLLRASETVTAMVDSFGEDDEVDEDEVEVEAATSEDAEEEGEGGFNVEEYGVSADKIGLAAAEVRALVGDVRSLAGSEDLQKPLTELNAQTKNTVDHTSTQARSLVDHITWRAVQLIGLFFAVAFVYRLAVARWAKAGSSKS